jgi:hypothetical protein
MKSALYRFASPGHRKKPGRVNGAEPENISAGRAGAGNREMIMIAETGDEKL